MKKNANHALLLLAILFFSLPLMGAIRPEAPRFAVKSETGELLPAATLPLIHTEADVSIAGVIADVKVTQVYVNNGDAPLEAIYVFPGSSQTAVYGMKMTIADRVIEAVIKEKKEAKKDYEAAKKEGKSASLLEQHRPNVFQMNVANLLPGDTIKVELSYNEVLTPEDGIYTFFYPVVMGERYDGKKDGSTGWMKNFYANPDTHKQAAKSYTFDMNVQLAAGLPISNIESPTHLISVVNPSADLADIGLKNGKGYEGDRNFVLRYRLSNSDFQTGMMLYKGKKENFFMMMVQPPKRVEKEQIPPREYVFIVDVSGSMNGFPIKTSKALLRDLIGGLRSSDLFNVLLFAGSSEVLSNESIPATPTNIQKALDLIDDKQGSGGTEVLPALKRAFALPTTEDFSRTFIVATDGLVTVEREAFDLIRNNLNKANVFPFGIGQQMNEFMIKGMAHAGQGEAFIVNDPKEAKEQAARFQKMIESPVLTNIETQIKGFKAYDIEPISLPDVFAERPLIIYGKYKGKPKGTYTLKGQSGNKPYQVDIAVNNYKPDEKNEALKYLWARQKIRVLQDYNNLGRKDEQLVEEITELGLKYNLLTDYTSFIAVDSEIRMADNTNKKKKNVIQHLAQNNSGGVPEPHEWAMIFMLFGLTVFLYYNRS